MKKQVFFFALLLAAAAGLRAQDKTTLGLTYQYGLPMGAFKNNFVQNGSTRGLAIDFLYAVNPKWRIGGGASYQDFYQKNERRLYGMEDGSTISAVVSNSLQVTPVLAKAMYLPVPEKRLQPFLQAGLGGNLVQVNQAFGRFDNINNVHLGFAAQAGAGLKYGLGAERRTHLMAGVLYNYMPFNRYDIGNLNHLTFGAGIRLTLRQDNSRGDDDGFRDGRRQPRRYNGW